MRISDNHERGRAVLNAGPQGRIIVEREGEIAGFRRIGPPGDYGWKIERCLLVRRQKHRERADGAGLCSVEIIHRAERAGRDDDLAQREVRVRCVVNHEREVGGRGGQRIA